ncbi:response regulator transcription factor [Butyrivibrio sp. XB500-5]|uniref:response regulator transcription factor n=1 Tax=Butyrivibrio sp. XB500-5 TaxID=2364880 RepID=UPI001FAA0D3A|nr:response regulator [Butyrivibrio sp. XB500-5]
MHRIMIVDDEKAIRNLIKKLIKWDELDAEFVGEAKSGIEAIQLLDDLMPDIILVDIRMPFMDGLTFIKYLREIYENISVIVISAYSDFEYARQCIELGVEHYLLKPISENKLNETVADSINRGRKRINESKESSPSEYNINRYVAYMKKNYANPELSMSYAAKHFGFSSGYFSRKFKEVTGETFVDSLTSYRMERAMEMALKGELMYMAAEAVGIPDVSYFGKCFKRHTGMSYTEYAKDGPKGRG